MRALQVLRISHGRAPWKLNFLKSTSVCTVADLFSADSLHSAPAERTVYDYAVDGDEIFGSIWRGKIEQGSFYGRATGPDSIELLYHCETAGGEEPAGWSRGDISIDAAGHTTLFMAWGWLATVMGGTTPDYVELTDLPADP